MGRLAAELSAVLLGLVAGAMLVIATVLVPFWRASEPRAFRAWFAVHAPRLRRLMVPLALAATIAVNEPTNARLAAPGLADDETTTLLARWARWHWLRVALGVGALYAAVRSAGALGA